MPVRSCAADLSKILGEGEVQAKAMPSGGWVAGQCAWSGPTSGFLVSVGTEASIAAAGDPCGARTRRRSSRHSRARALPPRCPGSVTVQPSARPVLPHTRVRTYFQITNLGLTEDQLVEIAKQVAARV